MKRFFAIQMCFFAMIFCSAQNLVPNPSFEDTTECGTTMFPEINCNAWYSAQQSPDYYTDYPCPYVYPITYQNARTGLSYAGLYLWQPFGCVREYFGVRLMEPLVAGNYYCLKFYISRHESYMHAVNRIGVYFSTDTIYNHHAPCNMSYIAQIETGPNAAVISDTLNWLEISGEYLATGGEEYITIGNFLPDDSTTHIDMGAGLYNGSYYFIDDVSLINCSKGGMEDLVSKFTIYPNPAADWININMDFEGEAHLILYDASGRKILYHPLKQETSINIAQLNKGIYVYEVIHASALIKRGKLIKD